MSFILLPVPEAYSAIKYSIKSTIQLLLCILKAAFGDLGPPFLHVENYDEHEYCRDNLHNTNFSVKIFCFCIRNFCLFDHG